MSLPWYKPKTRPAPWTLGKPSNYFKSKSHALESGASLRAPRIGRRRIKPISDRFRSEKALYRVEARAFVRAEAQAGLTCPVIGKATEIKESGDLRLLEWMNMQWLLGMKYGHPVSDKLNEVHHVRGRLGRLLRDKRWWMAVSKQGHRWIHENPEAARELGFLAPLGKWNKWEP